MSTRSTHWCDLGGLAPTRHQEARLKAEGKWRTPVDRRSTLHLTCIHPTEKYDFSDFIEVKEKSIEKERSVKELIDQKNQKSRETLESLIAMYDQRYEEALTRKEKVNITLDRKPFDKSLENKEYELQNIPKVNIESNSPNAVTIKAFGSLARISRSRWIKISKKAFRGIDNATRVRIEKANSIRIIDSYPSKIEHEYGLIIDGHILPRGSYRDDFLEDDIMIENAKELSKLIKQNLDKLAKFNFTKKSLKAWSNGDLGNRINKDLSFLSTIVDLKFGIFGQDEGKILKEVKYHAEFTELKSKREFYKMLDDKLSRESSKLDKLENLLAKEFGRDYTSESSMMEFCEESRYVNLLTKLDGLEASVKLMIDKINNLAKEIDFLENEIEEEFGKEHGMSLDNPITLDIVRASGEWISFGVVDLIHFFKLKKYYGMGYWQSESELESFTVNFMYDFESSNMSMKQCLGACLDQHAHELGLMPDNDREHVQMEFSEGMEQDLGLESYTE